MLMKANNFLAFRGPPLALQIRFHNHSSLAIHRDLFRLEYSATQEISAYVLALPHCTLV